VSAITCQLITDKLKQHKNINVINAYNYQQWLSAINKVYKYTTQYNEHATRMEHSAHRHSILQYLKNALLPGWMD